MSRVGLATHAWDAWFAAPLGVDRLERDPLFDQQVELRGSDGALPPGWRWSKTIGTALHPPREVPKPQWFRRRVTHRVAALLLQGLHPASGQLVAPPSEHERGCHGCAHIRYASQGSRSQRCALQAPAAVAPCRNSVTRTWPACTSWKMAGWQHLGLRDREAWSHYQQARIVS